MPTEHIFKKDKLKHLQCKSELQLLISCYMWKSISVNNIVYCTQQYKGLRVTSQIFILPGSS